MPLYFRAAFSPDIGGLGCGQLFQNNARRSSRCQAELSFHSQRRRALRLLYRPANLSWKTVVTSLGEPGEPLNISGTISQPDGKPAEGIVLFIYHTDATGFTTKTTMPAIRDYRAG